LLINHKQKYLLIYNIRRYNKIKIKKYHTVGTVPKFNRKIDTPNTHIHDRLLSWFATGTSLKVAGLD